MLQHVLTLVPAVLGASDPQEHVIPHGIAPIIRSWNVPLPLFNELREFWFTNHLLMTLVAAVLTLLIFVPIGRRYQAAMADVPINESVPRGFASLIEAMMDALRTGVVKPVLEADTDRFMPFLWTVFFFILINNLLGMVPLDPFFSLFGLKHVGGTATGNVNVTAGLALCAFAMIHFSGTREVFEGLVAGTYGHHDNDEGEGHSEHGHDGAHRSEPMSPAVAFVAAPGIYLFNFAPHVFPVQGRHGRPGVVKRILMLVVYIPIIAYGYRYMFLMFGVSPAAADVCQWVGAFLGLVFALNASGLHPLDFVDAVMWGFLFFLECIGAVVKPFALCMRLFANMIAGHIVLGSILLLLPVFKGLTIGYFASSLPITLGCVLLSGLELFVAFLQAYIFMFLTTMFIGAAVHPEH